MHPIVGTHVLHRHDVSIHESAHYVVGRAFGVPVEHPTIADDRQSGLVAVRPKRPAGFDQAAFRASLSRQDVIDLAVVQAAFCLCGYAAEAKACRCVWAPHYIIAGGTSDLDSAIKLLEEADLDHFLFETWQIARDAVDTHWAEIVDFAKTL